MTHDNPGANYLDAGAVLLWIASLANFLPSIAALLSIIWLLIRIAESETVQQMLGSWRWIRDKRTNDQD